MHACIRTCIHTLKYQQVKDIYYLLNTQLLVNIYCTLWHLLYLFILLYIMAFVISFLDLICSIIIHY